MYSSSNMLRARKKDASFKPNRVLDKKSSRGMLYENEELRLRTIHINDEVERGHHDIKKLKRENEHLKREIWNLRDEYEKMEQMLHKVIAKQDSAGEYLPPGIAIDEDGSYVLTEYTEGSPPEDESSMLHYPKYQHQTSQSDSEGKGFNIQRKGSRTTVESSGTTMYGSEDEEMNFMLMIEEDNKSVDSSVVSGIQQQASLPLKAIGEDIQFIEAEVDSHMQSEMQDEANAFHQVHQNYWQHMSSVPPELEAVTEESEHNLSNGSPCPRVISPTPSPNLPGEMNSELMNPPVHPVIEITPATTITNNDTNSINDISSVSSLITVKDQVTENGSNNNQFVQDGGCFTAIPQKFEVSSLVKISNNGEIESVCVDTKEIPSMKIQSFDRRNKYLRKGSFQNNQTLTFPNKMSQQHPPFLCFYQSEPSLHSMSSPHEAHLGIQDNKKMSLDSAANKAFPFYHPNLNYNSSSLGWSCGDKNVVIGYVEEVEGNAEGCTNSKLKSLEVKGIIDELETQFEPSLENISSVRIMTTSNGLTRIFIILKTSAALKSLIEKGLTLASQKARIRLIDATNACSTLVLSGLPFDSYGDFSIISFLNQYGQIVGPLERRLYKGIDISECQIQIHLVRNLPSLFNINGYEIRAKLCQTQEPETDTQPTTLTTGRLPVMLEYPYIENNSLPSRNSKSKANLEQPFSTHQILSRTNQVDYAKSQVPIFAPAQSTRLMRQASPSPSVQTTTSQTATPSQTPIAQPKGGHSAVRRSISSVPRLESNGLNPDIGIHKSPSQQTLGRKMSVCHALLEQGAISHLSNSSPKTGQPIGNGNAVNQSPKKSPQFSRVSQGNLIPEIQQQQALSNDKPFYRSMSIDPRRNSNSSRQQGFIGERMVRAPSKVSVNDRDPRMYLTNQMPNSSQLGQNGKAKQGPAQKPINDEQKSLPWCGCWGNGCL